MTTGMRKGAHCHESWGNANQSRSEIGPHTCWHGCRQEDQRQLLVRTGEEGALGHCWRGSTLGSHYEDTTGVPQTVTNTLLEDPGICWDSVG